MFWMTLIMVCMRSQAKEVCTSNQPLETISIIQLRVISVITDINVMDTQWSFEQ